MKKSISFLLACVLLLTSCMSTTTITSEPSGAKVYLNGEPVGETPYVHKDTKITGSVTTVRLEKEGYETLNTSFARDEETDIGAIVGGIFFLVPFLWVQKYKSTHNYELKQSGQDSGIKNSQDNGSKPERLRELKQLLDEGVITQEEYEEEKKKVLEEKQ